MNTAVISLGSNVTDREEIVRSAIADIQHEFMVEAVSAVYEAPDDRYAAMPYSNAVMRLSTDLGHDLLHAHFKAMESRYGRTPESKKSRQVPLDIDIVIFNDTIVRPADFSRSYFIHGYTILPRQVSDV